MKKQLIAALAALAIALFAGCEESEYIIPISKNNDTITLQMETPNTGGKFAWDAYHNAYMFNEGDSVFFNGNKYALNVTSNYATTATINCQEGYCRGKCYYPADNVNIIGGTAYTYVPRVQTALPSHIHGELFNVFVGRPYGSLDNYYTMIPAFKTLVLSLFVSPSWNNIGNSEFVLDSVIITGYSPLWGRAVVYDYCTEMQDWRNTSTCVLPYNGYNRVTPGVEDMQIGCITIPANAYCTTVTINYSVNGLHGTTNLQCRIEYVSNNVEKCRLELK